MRVCAHTRSRDGIVPVIHDRRAGFLECGHTGTTDPGFRLLRTAEYNINDFSLGGNVWVTNSGGTVGINAL